MKIPSSNLERTCCVQKLFLTFRTIFVHNMFSPCSAKRRISDKDLPVKVTISFFIIFNAYYFFLRYILLKFGNKIIDQSLQILMPKLEYIHYKMCNVKRKKVANIDSTEVILRHNALTRLARRAFCHISDRSIYPLEAETHRKDISPVM